ncbi:hypothetical protein BDF22DRAFT_380284 [Syncephalis plumigaleata]|nr:hypothetical protein BDF22DRAFT_380284 [Syncephalis plumigaleata]
MNKRTRESKSLGINRGVVRPKPKETPRLARTVRELRSQHLQNVSDASNRDNVHNTSVISNNDISVSSDSTVDTHDISNNSRIMGNTADLPASLSVFPHTPATVSRPRSDQSTNDTVSLDISPLPARLLVSLGDTTTTAAAAKNDANPLDMNSDKPLTITSPFGCAFPRTPMAASTIATETNRTSNDSRTNMVTPVIQRNTLFASQLVPVSGNGYIASAEDTRYRTIISCSTQRSFGTNTHDGKCLVTPCVRRTRRADNSKLFKAVYRMTFNLKTIRQ